MSYQTGSASSAVNLMDTLLTFAQAEGWSDVSGDWPISKGNCYINYGITNDNFDDYDTYAGNPVPKELIRVTQGTSLPGAAPGNWWEMPGGLATSATSGFNSFMFTNGASILAYHFFTDPAVSDYIHVVIQISAEIYQHLSFGNIDKRGLTHSGVGYLTCQSSMPFSNSSGQNWRHNNVYDYFRGYTGNVGESQDGVKYGTYLPIDVLPVGYVGNNVVLNNSRLYDTIGLRSGSQLNHNGSGIFPQRHTPWSLGELAKPFPPTGGMALYSLPVIIHQTTSQSTANRCVYTGEFPGVRFTRMDGMSPGDEFTFGGDTWKVFPMLRYTEVSQYNQPLVKSSASLAFAYKKVV